jgi:hypothetical protein
MIIKLNVCKVKAAYMDKGDMKFAEMTFPSLPAPAKPRFPTS